jgi:hypothetical protein
MTVDDLANHMPGGQTSVVVLLAGLLVSIVTVIGRRAAAAVARLEASVQRLGGRLGALETDLDAETTRRRQLEQSLREDRIRLPYWPKDPPELYLAGLDEEYPLPPRTAVPPFPPTEAARYAQHARHQINGDPL